MTITLTDVVAEIRKLAAEQPDFVYSSPDLSSNCLYVHRDDMDRPIPGEGCIVGQALVRLGLDPDDVDRRMMNADMLLESLGIDGTGDEMAVILAVQQQQDTMHNWREAVAFADRHVPMTDA